MNSDQQTTLNFELDNFEPKNSPVTCLGIEFPNDEARRQYFTEKLREFLADPEFRKIEGFPIGSDEGILDLGDPPYYTACPNPWIGDFIRLWEVEKKVQGSRLESSKLADSDTLNFEHETLNYHREPFAADVSEGKTHPVYKAHSYHTKVPHLVIVPSIVHYTEPGDIFHVQRCVTVPLSSAEFYAGLSQRFSERDGMYFLPNQAIEYDKKRMKVEGVEQLSLFVSDEASARQWLREQLRIKPQTFQELHLQFIKEIAGWNKSETPLELSTLLEQNFLRYDGKGKIPAQIISWMRQSFKWRPIIEKEFQTQGIELAENLELETLNLELRRQAADRWYVPDPNKAGDLEKLREKALLKEFEEYKQARKKLKVFRLEAVRAGFKKAWQEREYQTIITVAEKIPSKILEEDPKLLMWYDQAVTRMGGE